MIRRGKLQRSPQLLHNIRPEISCEPGVSVGGDRQWHAVLEDHSIEERACHVWRCRTAKRH